MKEPKPNNKRRILAWIAAGFLVCLYLLTLLAALFDSSPDRSLFKLSVFCSLVFPILIYIFLLLSRLRK